MSERFLYMQDIFLRLSRFWADQGCLVAQPHDVEVGAGTMNPVTFLRSLGPEPWAVAYVEPSRRPADARYGDNPNRLYEHHQYQVIIKPSPPNIQELYLQSLEALGIDPHEHDIRFVEDNWEAPTLAAWGLGWEVWLDGMEVTQFTYFQQIGGYDCRPVAVELTYGLERLASYIQNVDSVYDVLWAPGVTYREYRRQFEFEQSAYGFDTADVSLLLGDFDRYEAEAERVLAAGLVQPAYDYVLKCSHTFNTLEARGAIAVAQRAAYIGRVRNLARKTAKAWLAQREALGYPLLTGAARAEAVAEGLIPADLEPVADGVVRPPAWAAPGAAPAAAAEGGAE